MTETNLSIQRLLDANPLREPVLRSVIQTVNLPAASHGIDVGCGIGLQALLLAEAVGSAGHITGVDVAPELLAFAENMIEEAGFSGKSALGINHSSSQWIFTSRCRVMLNFYRHAKREMLVPKRGPG